jgi:ribonuclease E
VQLRSGGYIVLNQTEALVSIDVNSGRATREHHIEDTALKTNLEASEEVARQLRLRDLAGLIVIDFIDMDEKRNNRAVERRLKECLRHDRARIQVGRISHFGLLEMSRQRIRTSVLESSTEKCPFCGGSGHTRSVSSVTLQLLRTLEEMLIKGATHNLIVRTRSDVALYVLNQKRAHLRELEQRFRVTITVNADPTVGGQTPFVIDRGEQVQSLEAAKALVAQPVAMPVEAEEAEEADEAEDELDGEEAEEEEETEAEDQADEEAEGAADAARPNGQPAEPGSRRRRRRRRRPRGERPDQPTGSPAAELQPVEPPSAEEPLEPAEDSEEGAEDAASAAGAGDTPEERERRRRRRGRRGGRRRRGREGEAEPATAQGEHGADGVPSGPADEFQPVGPPEAQPYEPELQSAVADFDRPPADAPSGEPPSVQFAPLPAEAAAVEPPPRRRSAVREPAPLYVSAATAEASPPVASSDVASPPPLPEPAPPPEPQAAEKEPERDERPRRTGWWARRFAGDKS